MQPDTIDQKLVGVVQSEFPLTREPYADMGRQLGISQREVISRITGLKAKGIIRQISPVIDARRLGFQPTLVAMRVSPDELGKAEQAISQHPGVSHGYQRDHYFNIWFTLTVPQRADTDNELAQLTASFHAEETFTLPAVKMFKIGAYFDMGGDSVKENIGYVHPCGDLPKQIELSQQDKLVINELQQDLPLTPAPFASMAAQAGMDIDQFLVHCQSLLKRGAMRRFGAAINHKRAGFKANAMTCWAAPPDVVDAAGGTLASLRQVSHCYERKTNHLWRYNLFAMTHSHTREECQKIARDLSRQIGLEDYLMLFSTREFKKERVKYLL